MQTPGKPIPGTRPAWPAAWLRHPLGWLVAFMLAGSAAFIALRMVTPSDGTQVAPRTWAWTGAGVVVQEHPDRMLHDGDLVTAIDGVALGGAGRGWRVPAYQPGDRLTYQVVRAGRTQEVTVTLQRADVAGPLLRAWGTILFVVVLFGVVAYLYARRAGPATAALLVLGGGLLTSTLAVEIGMSALDTRGGPLLWLYLLNTHAMYLIGWAGQMGFVLLFPRPWPPLARHRRLLPVVSAAPPALLAAWALAALGGVGFTRWVGRVIAMETLIVTAVLGMTIVLAMARYLTATDPIARQQLKWLVGGGSLSATLAVAVWVLRSAAGGRPDRGGPALPPVRPGPDHQPHRDLRPAHGAAWWWLRGGGAGARPTPRPRPLQPGSCGGDAGGRRGLPARSPPRPGRGGPPLQPPPLRRGPHHPDVHRAAPPADRLGHPDR
jgi:hypothetical protein